MNNIYKVVFSKAKNCYVVASELAKGHTKSASTKKVATLAVVGATALSVLSGGAFADSYSAGSGASAGGSQSIAIGNNAVTQKDNGIAIGDGARVNSGATQNSIAIGKGASVGGNYGDNNVVIGTNAQSNSTAAVVIGQNARITRMQGNRSVVIGNNATTENTGSVVIGDGAQAAGGGGVSVGQESYNNNGWASALGFQARAEGGNSTSIGAKSRTAGQNAGAFGFQASASGTKAYAVGTDAAARNEGSLAIGSTAVASANLAQAIGWGAQSSGTSATAIGVGSNASGESSVAIGHNAAVTTQKNVSLGADSTDAGTSVGAGLSYATALSGVAGTPSAVVSVGKADFTRKLSYVGAGVADTDAVNVAQLKSLADNKLSLTADGNTRTDKIALGVTGDTTDTRLSLGIIGDGSYIKTEATGTNVKVSFNAAKMAKNSPTVYVNNDGEIVAQGTDGKFYPIKDLNEDGTPKNGATEVPKDQLKVAMSNPDVAAGTETTANKPTELNGIASTIKPANLANVDNASDPNTPAVTADEAVQAVSGGDNSGNGGFYAKKGADLFKAANVGDLQAIAKAGTNYTADAGDAKKVNRPLGTSMAFLTGVNAEGNGDFAAADANSNLGTIISPDNYSISFVMKKKPTFEGLTLAKDGNTVNMDPTAKGLDMGGSKITNIGDGEISATSTDAITGKQIAGLKHNITSNDSTITVSNGGALFENNVDLSIANGAITADKLAANAVTGDKIADDAITGDKIKDGTITAEKLAPGVISGDSLTNGAVDADKLANDAVTEDKIKDGAVTKDKIADGAVDADKLANDAVTEDKIKDGAVTKDKIADGAVDTNKLANNAVTEDKLADNAVTANKIADGAVTTNKLGAGAVTTEKIATGAITTDKLAPNSVTGNNIQNGTITADKIAARDKGDITSNDLTVTGNGKVLGGDIQLALKDGAVTKDKLNQDLKNELANIATNTTNIASKLDSSKAKFNLASDETSVSAEVNLADVAVPTIKVITGTAVTATNQAEYSGKNLGTKIDANNKTIEILIVDKPTFKGLSLQDPNDTNNPPKTVSMNFAGDKITFGTNAATPADTRVVLSGLKDDVADPNSALTRSAFNDEIRNMKAQIIQNDLLTAGAFTYMDKNTNKRLMRVEGDFYDLKTVEGLRRAKKDGKWYTLTDFDDDGKLKASATPVDDIPQTNPEDVMVVPITNSKDEQALKTMPVSNVQSALDLVNMPNDVTQVTNNIILVQDAKTAVETKLLTAKGKDLYKATTLGDLQAVAQAGLTFKADDKTQEIHRPLGTSLSLTTGRAITATNKTDYDFANPNLATQIDPQGTITFAFKTRPTFSGIKFADDTTGSALTMTPKGQLAISKNGKNELLGFNVKRDNGTSYFVPLNGTLEFKNTSSVGVEVDGRSNNTTSSTTAPATPAPAAPASGPATLSTGTALFDAPGGVAPVATPATNGVDATVTFEVKPNATIELTPDKMKPNSIVNKQYVDNLLKADKDDMQNKILGKISELSSQASAGTASALAAAGVPQIINVDAQNLIGVGFGNYNGERAIAIGYTGTNKDRDVIYRLTGTYDSSKKFGLSAGVGFTFGKKTSYKEDQIVRENNFYEIIQRQQFEIASLRDMNAKNQEEIAELKAQIKLILEKQK